MFKTRILGVFEPVLFAKPYLGKGSFYFVAVLAAGIISNLALLYVPIFIGDSVSALESAEYQKILHFGILIVAAYSISAIVSFIVNYGSQFISQTYAFNLRKDVVAHLVRKKFHFFETQTSGDLLSRGTMDIQASQNFVLNAFSSLFPTIFLIIEGFVLLLFISPYFSLLLALVAPALVYLGILSSRKQRPLWRGIRTTFGRLGETIQENVVGQRVVRGLSAEGQEIDKFSGLTKEYYGINDQVGKVRGIYNSLMPVAVAGASSVVIGLGGYLDLINRSSVGGLVAAVTIFAMLTNPVSFLGRMIVFSENQRAAIVRIKEITESGEEETVDFSESQLLPGVLQFDRVKFSRGDKVILRDVSFKAAPGEFIGITGNTGAGKTSLVNLITRYYDPDSGAITIGGRNILEIPLSVLRGRISIVPQEINLLSGTIRENILFGTQASDGRIREVARIAAIADFIESLPKKYETLVGERGITLSGGQRQRIAIARAVLRRPLILILDDATSSVDPDTEITIFENLKKLLAETIIVMISLRPSALSFAKKVLFLEGGALKEETEPLEEINVDRV